MAKKTYVIVAKRWFGTTNGNTYHSVSIYHGAELIAHNDSEYGYGSAYEQTALKLLKEKGIAKKEHAHLWKWQESIGRENVLILCSDVARQGDL